MICIDHRSVQLPIGPLRPRRVSDDNDNLHYAYETLINFRAGRPERVVAPRSPDCPPALSPGEHHAAMQDGVSAGHPAGHPGHLWLLCVGLSLLSAVTDALVTRTLSARGVDVT